MSAVKNQLIIGDNSCLGLESCFQIKSSTDRRNRDKDTVIGDGSCKAAGSCSNFRGVSIGSNSCNCEGCCSCFGTGELPDEIPPDSCNVRGECCATDAPTGVPSSGPTDAPTTAQPTDAPSTSPPTVTIATDAPTSTLPIETLADCQRAGSTTDIINCLSEPGLLADPSSPQSQALQWILDSPEVDSWDGLELSQRYVVGVMWASSDDGLQSFGNQDTPICGTFQGLSCNAESEIIDWELYATGGTLPREIGALTALQTLSVISLSGTIPSEIGSLTALNYLDSSSLGGQLPTEIGLLTNLVSLWLGGCGFGSNSNSGFTGTIPSEIGQLTPLGELDLRCNNFSGTLPSEIGLLTNLQDLRLNDNGLDYGTIPTELGQLTDLFRLDIINEFYITGTIPSEIGQLTRLGELNLEYTKSLVSFLPKLVSLHD